jgi:hypothetical protein
MDDDRNLSDRDPAKLLPFVCELRPSDPNVEQLPPREYNWYAEQAREPDDVSISSGRD